MENLIKKISDIGVVPVIKIDNAKDAVPLAAALKKGGICCAEVTFRTDAAEEAIDLLHRNIPIFLLLQVLFLLQSRLTRQWQRALHLL